MPWYAIYLEGSPPLLLVLVAGCVVALRFRRLASVAAAGLVVTTLLACVALPTWFRLVLALRGAALPWPTPRDLGDMAFGGLLFGFPVGLLAAVLSVALRVARPARERSVTARPRAEPGSAPDRRA